VIANVKCFHHEIINDRDYSILITGYDNTICEGVTISIHEVESSESEYFPGVEMNFPMMVEPGKDFSFFICYHTHVALEPKNYFLETKFIMEKSEVPIDDTPPTVFINKPEEHSLYVFDRKIHSNFCCKTMILGPININIEAIDESGTGIDYVEFYINDNFRTRIFSEPFAYRWSSFAFGFYTIRINAYDNNGNSASESIIVFKMF